MIERCVLWHGSDRFRLFVFAEIGGGSIMVFNKMPDYVSDSVKKEGLGNGDYICGSNVVLYDVKHLN